MNLKPSALRWMRALLFGASMTALSVTAQAQDLSRIDRPSVKVGDSWTYRYSDNWKKLPNATFVHRVTEATDSRIRVAVSNAANEQFPEAIYSSEWNTYQLAGTTYAPVVNDHSFPLSAGKSWKSSFSYKRADGGETRCEQTATVVGVERVTVAGGTFDTVKITINGSWKWASGGNFNGSFTKTVWYARDTRRWVKILYADFDAQGTAFANETWELVSHKLQ
jgi:hypothetical protein